MSRGSRELRDSQARDAARWRTGGGRKGESLQ